MEFTVALAIFMALVASSQQHDPVGLLGSQKILGNSYTDTLIGNIRNRRPSTNCYDRCISAYRNGRNLQLRGCLCSQYDYSGVQTLSNSHVGSGPYNDNSNINCGCRRGTVCKLEYGSRTCVPRSESGGRRGRGYDAAVRPGPYGQGSRPSHATTGRCQPLPPVCLAGYGEVGTVIKFTYKYSSDSCIQQNVRASCHGQGSTDLFNSAYECRTRCLAGPSGPSY